MGGVRCLGLFPKKNRFFFYPSLIHNLIHDLTTDVVNHIHYDKKESLYLRMSERSGTTERISSYEAKFLLFVVLLELYILNCQRLIGCRPSCFLSTVVPIIVVRGKTVVRLDRCVVPDCR